MNQNKEKNIIVDLKLFLIKLFFNSLVINSFKYFSIFKVREGGVQNKNGNIINERLIDIQLLEKR
jgi:hypothetical protein